MADDVQKPTQPAQDTLRPADKAPNGESWLSWALRIAQDAIRLGKDGEQLYKAIGSHLQHDPQATERARSWLIQVADSICKIAATISQSGKALPESIGQIIAFKARIDHELASTSFASSGAICRDQLQVVEDSVARIAKLRSEESKDAEAGKLKQAEGFFRGVACAPNQALQQTAGA